MLGKGVRNSGKRSGGAKSQKTISELVLVDVKSSLFSSLFRLILILGQFKGQSR